MILADTSIWINFFRRGSTLLAQLLDEGKIIVHSTVLGELATGNLLRRTQTLAWLNTLPRCAEAVTKEALTYIETHKLYGRGLGWNDVQLLAGAQLSHAMIWSLDAALVAESSRLRLSYRNV